MGLELGSQHVGHAGHYRIPAGPPVGLVGYRCFK